MPESYPKKAGLPLFKSDEIANIYELFEKWWW
jgi:hypothetical protein